MRIEEIEVFKYDELSDSAKESAIQAFREQSREYFWLDEWHDSLKAFCKAMPITVNDWSISPYSHSYVKVDFDYEDAAELSGVRAFKWLLNNGYNGVFNKWTKKFETAQRIVDGTCPLTGYCGDNNLFDALAKFMTKPCRHTTLEELFQECVDDWMSGMIADMEYQDSDEYIEEHIEGNEYEFLKDGTIH